MSWHAPATYKELTESISRGWSFTSERFGLRGEAVQVLTSKVRPGLGLDTEHELSAAVASSARRRTTAYLAPGGTRQPKPDMYMYYVATLGHQGRVFVAVTASGDVQWAAVTSILDPRGASSMVVAVEELAKTYADITDNNGWT